MCEQEQEKIAKFFASNYKKDVVEKEQSLKGWNWGTAKFEGSVLSFDVGSHTGFEIPLNYVSQCTTGKNEVTLEFHQVRCHLFLYENFICNFTHRKSEE